MRKTLSLSGLSLLIALFFAPGRVSAQADTETFDSAVFVIKSCMQVSKDGRHIVMLRALRHLEDPGLEPLFADLVQSPYAPFKVHGMLGLAECNKERQLDLVRLAAMESSADQAKVISAAMNSDLLSNEQARQIINWPGMDESIKMLVATQLIKAHDFNKPEILQQAKTSEIAARKYLALMLLAQIGDAEALKSLDQLHDSTDIERDKVRYMLLSTAVQFGFDCMGPWAFHITTERNIPRQLSHRAMEASLRFNVPGIVEVWKDRFSASTDQAELTRLSLIALQWAQYVDRKVLDTIAASDDALLKLIGQTAVAVSSGKDIGPTVEKLVAMNYPIANTWALQYASKESAGEHATNEDAVVILTAIIRECEKAKVEDRQQRLDDAVSAAMKLFQRDPKAAKAVLVPILTAEKPDDELVQGVLLGLINSGKAGADELVKELPTSKSMAAQQLSLLVRARYGSGLTPEQLAELGLLVRGGGLRNGAMRIQAAWLYLKVTRQTDAALAKVLGQ